ncbi:MAG: hypothetical protein AAF768_05375 [Pseudomonadota bacterium]
MATLRNLRQDIFRLKPSSSIAPIGFPFGLGASGVHEVCETRHGDLPALLGFSLAAKTRRRGAILHVQQSSLGLEHGDILQAGAAGLQAQLRPVLSVHTRKGTDALWAIEEGIKSAAVGLVIADIEDCDFTASRRLVLASSRYGVPVILLMPHNREGATAAAARWRVRPRLSGNNRFDPRGLGAARWHAVLERSRQAPHLAGRNFDLEWNDETLSLTMVPGLAAHQTEARPDKSSSFSEQSQLRRYG